MTSVCLDPHRHSEDLARIFLEPGGLYCSATPAVIRTVLGSCVAVCLVDRYGRAAGMNHYVLPKSHDGPLSLRYGDVAIAELLHQMNRLGCSDPDLRAKVFGGAAVLPFGAAEETVGTKNVLIAIELLRRHSIPVVARRSGGENGLIIKLYTMSGRVMVRPIVGAGARLASGRIAIHDSNTGFGGDDDLDLTL